jgi:hypothetical protein
MSRTTHARLTADERAERRYRRKPPRLGRRLTTRRAVIAAEVAL